MRRNGANGSRLVRPGAPPAAEPGLTVLEKELAFLSKVADRGLEKLAKATPSRRPRPKARKRPPPRPRVRKKKPAAPRLRRPRPKKKAAKKIVRPPAMARRPSPRIRRRPAPPAPANPKPDLGDLWDRVGRLAREVAQETARRSLPEPAAAAAPDPAALQARAEQAAKRVAEEVARALQSDFSRREEPALLSRAEESARQVAVQVAQERLQDLAQSVSAALKEEAAAASRPDPDELRGRIEQAVDRRAGEAARALEGRMREMVLAELNARPDAALDPAAVDALLKRVDTLEGAFLDLLERLGWKPRAAADPASP